MNDDSVEELYNEVFNRVAPLVMENDPLAVAGILLAQALRMYRTVLNADQFDLLMDSIIATKDEIRPFENDERTLQ